MKIRASAIVMTEEAVKAKLPLLFLGEGWGEVKLPSFDKSKIPDLFRERGQGWLDPVLQKNSQINLNFILLKVILFIY